MSTNETGKHPIIIDAPDDDEVTNPGHATRVGIFMLKKSIEMLCDSVNELKVEIRALKPFTEAVSGLRRMVLWCAVSAGALAIAGAALWWARG